MLKKILWMVFIIEGFPARTKLRWKCLKIWLSAFVILCVVTLTNKKTLSCYTCNPPQRTTAHYLFLHLFLLGDRGDTLDSFLVFAILSSVASTSRWKHFILVPSRPVSSSRSLSLLSSSFFCSLSLSCSSSSASLSLLANQLFVFSLRN